MSGRDGEGGSGIIPLYCCRVDLGCMGALRDMADGYGEMESVRETGEGMLLGDMADTEDGGGGGQGAKGAREAAAGEGYIVGRERKGGYIINKGNG